MKNKLLYFFVIIAFLFQIPITQAKKLTPKTPTSRSPKVQFNTTNNQESLNLTIKEIEYKVIEDNENTFIQIEGFEQYMSPGNPILPHRIFRVALPPNINLETVQAYITVREQDTFYITKPIKPAPPFVASSRKEQIYTWGKNKDISNGYNKKIYAENIVFPKQALKILSSSTMRKWKTIELEFFPVFYNPISNQVQVIKEADISLSYNVFSKSVRSHSNLSDKSMDETASKLFDNYSQSRMWYEEENQAAQSGSSFEYVIITTENIKNGSNKLDEFEDFKETQGFNILTVTENNRYEDIDGVSAGSGWGGGTGDAAADNIRTWLSTNYSSIGIEYVLLIGNPTPSNGNVPMKMCWPRLGEGEYEEAPTDYYFADLTGNWDLDDDGSFGEYPDDFGANGVDKAIEVYVGRIPVYGTAYTTLDNVLEKLIDYGSDVGAKNWRKKVLLPMEPSDNDTDGYPLGEGIRNNHASDAGWSAYRIYDENFDCFPEKTPCNPTNVENEWQNNYGLVTWWTHGSQTIASDVFSISQCSNLDDTHPSFTFQCSCLNGYPETTNNLGYSLLVEGAVGTVSASRVSWYLPGNNNWDRNGTNSYLAYEYSGKIIEGFRCGKALYDVKMATFSGDAEYWMNLLVFNLYGDPALGINDPTWQNNPPVLSNPRVSPISGTESTNFEFLVDYYDPDGDPPDNNYKRVYLSDGRIVPMSLKSGSAYNGTYHYITKLPMGSYSYMFFFSDQHGLCDITNWQNGPYVYSDGDATVNITIQCTNIGCDLELKYCLNDYLTNPWVDIPITGNKLSPIVVPAGSKIWFNAGVDSPNHEYREWETYENGTMVDSGTSNTWPVQLGTQTTEIGLYVYYDYTPQNYTISGTVLREDSSLVPGGVDFTLSSSEQNLTLHTDNGNFSFGGVKGGVSVTVTPSAAGYAFTPINFVFPCLHDDKTGKTIVAYSSDSSVPTTSFINLPPVVNENSSVVFTWRGSDDITVPANLLYQYKLDGVDADWSAWSSSTSKTYDVNNGVYTFWVRAKDESGNINQAPISYEFVVNATPKVVSSVRTNRSVWASRVTLEMPVGAVHPTDMFVLMPEHSGMSDTELVPVTLHRVDETIPCGVSEIVASELGVTCAIVKSGSGWLVTLPESIPLGQSTQYDITWGKIKYFGWQEFVSVPNGFPNGGVVMNSYLDIDLDLWRFATKNDNHGTSSYCDDDGWAYMDIANRNGRVVDETELRFIRGECTSGDIGSSTNFFGGHIFESDNKICYMWRAEKYVWDGSHDYTHQKYGMHFFDHSGLGISAADGEFVLEEWPVIPKNLLHNHVWLTGTTNAVADYAWFIVLDEAGNEIISKTNFDVVTKPHYPNIGVEPAYPIGENVLLIWEREWETDAGYERKEIAYQVRAKDGQIVKNTTTLSPPLLTDSIEDDDEYDIDSVLVDNEGEVWISYSRLSDSQGGSFEFFYNILSTNGNVWKGPTETPNERRFNYCDKDGYIWATENGQFFALNADDTIAISPRIAAWAPNQNVGLLTANVSNSGYRLYDRWSPQAIEIDVPSGSSSRTMELFDLNLWDNELHLSNLILNKGDNSIWSQSGTFTGKATIDLTGVLERGKNILTLSQNDFLGGQVLVTFPYINTDTGDLTGNSIINFADLALIAEFWLEDEPSVDIAPLNEGDGIVNFLDFSIVAKHWFEDNRYPMLIYSFPLDTNPGWTCQGQWAFGQPTGNGGINGNPDPNSGYTSANVYGVNLNGDYSITIGGPYYLTSSVVDCTGFSDVYLKFARWLNTDFPPYVSSKIEVSNNGTSWQTVWEQPTSQTTTDSNWQIMEYDISGVADNQSTVYIRWSYELISDEAYPYSGWNIDDVQLWGIR